MALSAAQYCALIVVEVGDVDALVATQIDTLWEVYSSQTDVYLQYLLTKRKAIDLLMGKVREQVTRRGVADIEVALTDKLKNLQIMWGNVDREIRDLTALAREVVEQTTGAPVSGQLTATAPITPLSGPDANSLVYRGDPYTGRRW